ncbi:MAG: hypothetical protein JJ891_06960 [Rhizobiaceae bacterium]|nr:hypothetical protein [Rhizobiaceae bacterium]
MEPFEELPAYLHDKWDQQVELEKEMLALGESRMRDKINKAREKNDMNRLRPYRSLLKEWVLPVSSEIKEWVDKTSKKRGAKPLSLPLIRGMDPDVLAVVSLRTILRMLGNERRGILALAVEIGTWTEHEARAKAWEAQDPDSWNKLKGFYEKRGSTSTHQKRARIVIFNKHVAGKIVWTDWTDEQRLRVGLSLIDLTVKATGRFKVIGDPDFRPKRSKGRNSKIVNQRPMILQPDDSLLDWLKNAMDDELVFWPVLMPTVIPPKPWTSPRDGGYWTPFVRTPFLIRFHASHETQRQRAIDEYDAIDMPEVYGAINKIQNTGWTINSRVLEVANTVWNNDLAIAGLPRQEEATVPAMPPEAENDKQVYKTWAAVASSVRMENAKRFSKFISFRRTIVAANRFSDEEVFYFPHMLDFRGRMYPITSDLQPQGNDLHRGLLTFKESKPVTAQDAGWLAIQLANTWGNDKVSMDDRIAWVEENEALWRRIADDPLDDRSWAESSDPWQALAAIFEWVRWLDEGEGMMSSLPIRVDGTCNGLQHLSAMVLDDIGGASVNLIPSDKPRDIYQEVADRLTSTLESLKETGGSGLYSKWLDMCGGRLPRSLSKRPVMILPYGGTRHSYFQYIMDWIKDDDPDGVKLSESDRVEAVKSLVPLLWDAVVNTVVVAQDVMKWIQDNASRTTSEGIPLYWVTPSGFVVRHFYGERERKRIDTMIDGQRLQLVQWETKPILDPRAQTRGIAPNFVHSMDASALVTCVNIAADNGITSMTTIHDAYGTVAADMWTLSACIREAFIETYKEPVLEQFQSACKEIGSASKEWPEPLPKGKLNLEEIRDSDYFFA